MTMASVPTIDRPAPSQPAGRPRVLVVDDHRLVGDGLQTVLRLSGFDVTLSGCASAAAIVEEARAHEAELVLLDLELGPAGDGRELIRPLVALGARVLVITGQTDLAELAECLDAGAAGVVGKAEGFAVVLDKVQRLLAGEPVTPVGDRARFQNELAQRRIAQQVKTAPFEALTPRERDVLAMIVDGYPAAEIARCSFVSLATVRTQIRSVLLKLGVNSQLAAAAMARNAGWKAA